MALNIPLPGTPLQGLMQGVTTGGNLYSKIMNPILEREKQKQLENHFQEQLKLSKAAAARNAQLFPYRLQELQDKHGAAQFERNMMAQLMGGGSAASGQQMRIPTQETGEGMGMFSPEGLQDMQSMNHSNSSNGGLNERILGALKQNPMLRGWFKHKFNYDPLAETSDEKNQHAVNKAISIEEAKSNIKKLDEIEKTAQALMPYVGKARTVADILKRKPELTGRLTQLANFLGLTKDEDVGTFLSATQSLQAHMAKEMSQRGGYGVAKLVEQGKPNLGASGAYNRGVTKELLEGMKKSFEQMKSEYERLSGGKKFPYDFESFFNSQTGGGMVPMISPSGKRVMIPSNQVQAALASGGRHA